ncbi:alpha-endosulfine [Neodiprion pinetum]|uniref:Alpha-endosulfine n=1 Tax=Neodiprion lecontei TaxID=441921 RepID=A0A6J0BU05_NEOLC|nr:alpha-endosulfine [Neodiprion lecontei]XP_046491456.1 alpha-endosulfine [Neodiprion pinetum]XP_046629034.1 alpha-endosulfine [Neodiprion virginianus]
MCDNQKDEQTDETTQSIELSSNDIEKIEEAKLRAKFPNTGGRPISGHSAFLQKRLAKGQKYFDSGDYQMAKQKSAAKPKPAGVLPTGDAIPTPETVPQRKTSIIQQKFNTSTSS